MTSRVAIFLAAAAMALAPTAHASGKKDSGAKVSFHIETEATDNPKMIFPQLTNGERRFFRRMPEVGTKDIVSFSPFPAEGGEDYGIVFKLKPNVANRVGAITNVNVGKWMVSQINGRVVDGFLIDKQVTDGMLVVWKRVTLDDIAILDKQFPRIGQEGKKKKEKKADKE